MTKTILVSVVVPVYNVEKYLNQCLDSILFQTLQDIEIICVDDGSDDSSLEILKKYAENDNRLKIIQQKNLYAGVARNNGLKQAQGKYVVFLDSDDFFEPDMLELMYQRMEETEADICVADADFYNNEEGTYKIANLLKLRFCPNDTSFTREDLGENLYQFCTQVVWTKMYRRTFLEQYKFQFQDLICNNDTAFGYLTQSMAQKFAIIPKVLTHYRQNHGGSITSHRNKNCVNIFYAYQYIVSELKRWKQKDLIPLLNASYQGHVRYEVSKCSLKEYIYLKTQAQKLLGHDFRLFKEYFEIPFENVKKDVIISLTTYPGRILYVYDAVMSLLNQNLKVDKVILYLGADKFPNKEADLPMRLLDLVGDYFEIHWVEKDLRSYTKLIPALLEYPENIIVTGDDDILYPRNWLRKLLVSYLKYPKDIHCHRVHKIIYKDGQIAPYMRWKHEVNKSKESGINPDYFLTGVGGVLYPPHSLDAEVLNKEAFTRLSPTADDIWFWAMALKKGTRIRCIENANPKLSYVACTQEKESLLTQNNQQGQNDIQLQNVLQAYPEIKRYLNR
ncbi:MAG: glycosyltransferase family 2 protein [Alphaproteobacteria bacterium]|nr:glycosyltransferase family 2 protein [Alphaproteobacteria bacterium]